MQRGCASPYAARGTLRLSYERVLAPSLRRPLAFYGASIRRSNVPSLYKKPAAARALCTRVRGLGAGYGTQSYFRDTCV